MKSLCEVRHFRSEEQKEISKIIGITNQAFSYIETGVSVPTDTTRRKLSSYFGEPINWLATRKIPVKPRKNVNWNKVEREFRKVINGIASLPDDEKKEFIKQANRYLKHINN